MKKGFTMSIAAAVMIAGSTMLFAEPGNFGVNGKSAWTQPLEKRVKHTDSFGDTYYTYSFEKPKNHIQKEVEKESKGLKKAPQEVIGGLKATLKALEDLQKNNLKDAEAKLRDATRLFDQALKADPKLKLVPIDNDIEVFHFEGSVSDIKADIALARKLLKRYQTRAARDILMPLADEIVVTTHYIPMDLYPKAAKDALELLKKGKKDEAVRTLALGVGTIVAQESVIPIPLLSAQELVAVASRAVSKNPSEAQEHLKLAKIELHKALLLGYTDKDSKAYESIYSQITKIQKEIKAKHSTKSLFERVKKDIESLLQKKRSEKRELKDNGSVYKGTAKAHAKAAREETNDKLRFEEKMESDDF